MPEIKHQFTGGKMNKDIDERLIPNGEYRDAMNIQVSTSEGSEVGTVQNILGNTKIFNSCSIPKPIPALEERCVASIADEKNDTGYYFITSIDTQEAPYQIKRDMIIKVDGTQTTPVFVDPYRKTFKGKLVYPTTLSNANDPKDAFNFVVFDFTGAGNPNFIEPGDVITRIIFGIANVQENLNIKIVNVDNGSGTFMLLLRDIPDDVRPNLEASGLFAGEVTFTIGGKDHRVLNFDKDRLITGVNIIDDMLFWTDGVTEPKKIHINRSIKGTTNCLLKTKLIIDDDFVQTSYYNFGGEPVLTNAPCKEEHITVIKKSPSTALWTSIKDATELTAGYVGQPSLNNPPIPDGFPLSQPFNSEFNDPGDPTVLVVGDEQRIRLTVTNSLDINEDDIIVFNSTSLLLPSADSYQCKAKIIEYNIINQLATIKILAIDLNFDIDDTYNWAEMVEQKEDNDTFKNKLPRFSYRYKYEDGEYSCFAPFTNIVFSPGTFGYEPKEAYNLGMENTITSIAIKGYKNNIPLGVVQVDLLYKESNSPVVYLIDSIKPNKTGIGTTYWENPETGYVVKPNLIRAILPSNQLLRPFDNVPRSALSQEITANRLVYANYLQNYNVDFTPLLDVSLKTNTPTDVSSLKARSLKSMRNYTLGVAYLDKFNRQSPVFSSKQSNITIPIASSKNLNRVTIEPVTEPPHWATHYKVFVKDTSNEYYNLSMDRVYEAEDDNVWLSFPSSDRNKVTDETFLILKKDVLSSTPITVKNRYKILAIESEAPDFIKTRKPLIAQTASAASDIFPDSDYAPRKDVDRIKIDWELWNQEEISLEDIEKPISVRFSTINSSSEPIFSRFYEVSSFSIEEDSNANNPPDFYDIKLTRSIKEDWLTQPNYPLGSQNTEDILEPTLRISVHRKILENRAEFDGRFFVKISKDPLIESNVLTQIAAGLTTDLVGGTTLPFYFLADGDNTQGFDGNTNNDKSDTRGNWSELVKFGGTTRKGRWFIDATWHAGGYNEDVPANDPYCPGCSGKKYLRTEGMLKINDAPNMIGYPNWPDYFIGDRGTGGFNDGIYEDGGKYYIDLAYTKIGRDLENPNAAKNTSGTTGYLLPNEDYHGTSFMFENPGYGQCHSSDDKQLNWSTKTCGSWSELDVFGNRKSIISECDNNMGDEEGEFGRNFQPWRPHPTIDDEYAGCNPNFSWYSHLTLSGTGFEEARKRDHMCELADLKDSPFYPPNDDNDRHFKVGSYVNPEDEDEVDIVQSIVEGNKFRFLNSTQNEDAIYTIKNVDVEYYVNYSSTRQVQNRYNWWATMVAGDPNTHPPGHSQYRSPREGCNGYRPGSASGGGPSALFYFEGCGEHWHKLVREEMEAMAQDYNRKTVYKIEIDRNPLDSTPAADGTVAWNPIAQDSTAISEGAATNNQRGTIQFLTTQSIQDVEGLQSDNPAIWETEQNSDNDLDIYYEIDDAFPLEINNDTNYDFAPVGSTFDPNGDIEKGDAQYTVVEWDGNYCKLDKHITPEHENDWYDTDITKINFLRPNGSIVKARFLGITNPISVGGNHGQSKWIILDKNVSQYKIDLSWYNCYSFGNGVESDRIRDDFNQVRIDKGAKASSTIEEPYQEEHRKYGLIYSGLYNSNSGVNNLNQFIQAEKITKDINPTYGSIQKLHARDTDLITLCEDKCLRILSNKDAVFNADGNANLVATENVLGQTIPFSGEFGISTNPESFASEAYRSYFTDKIRGVVLRLSKDGLTPISMYGMKDWFRDNLRLSNKIIGSYDDKKDEYNIALKGNNISKTVTFREDVKGWVSFKSFVYENAISIANEYYTFYDGELFKHHVESENRNTFYKGHVTEPFTPSSINVILNDQPDVVKSFHTLNYAGSQTKVDIFETKTTDDFGNIIPATTDEQYFNLEAKKGWYVESFETDKEKGSLNEFIEKEGKWFNYLRGQSVIIDPNNPGHVLINEDGSSSFDQASFAIQGIGTATTQSVVATPSWDCNNGVCFDPGNGSGTYASLADCQSNCIAASWDCDPSAQAGCSDPGTGNGAYSSLSTCQTGCLVNVVYGCMDCGYIWEQQQSTPPNFFTFCPGNITGTFSDMEGAINYNPGANTDDGSCMYLTPTWDCGPAGCFDPGTGFGAYADLADCQSACGQQPAPSWNCTLTGCDDPGTGNGQYTTEAACQAACTAIIGPVDCSVIAQFEGCDDWNNVMDGASNYTLLSITQHWYNMLTSAGYQNIGTPPTPLTFSNLQLLMGGPNGCCGEPTSGADLFGCTDPTADNYLPLAVQDDYSCCYTSGCGN